MDGRNPLTWKAAALPLAALTAALAVGTAYFAGGSDDQADPRGASARFQFDSRPQYAPGSLPAKAPGQPGSSIDMFRKANEGYSSEAAAVKVKAAAAPGTRKDLEEFARQSRHEVEAQSAQAAGNSGAPGGGGRAAGGTAAKDGETGSEAGAAAVYSRPGGGSPGPALSGSLKSRKGAFSTGRLSGAALPGSGGGTGRTHGVSGRGYESSVSGGGSGGYSEVYGGASGGAWSGGWSDSFARGGGASQQSQGGGGASAGEKKAGGGAQQEEKPKPAPAAMVWPRGFDFGAMYMYETAARQVIVMNVGDADLRLGKISNLDPGMPFSAEQDKCSSATLAPGKSCTFRVRFSPGAVREYLTGFEIPSNEVYPSYIEIKGSAKYSYSTWWWRQHWSGPSGFHNRADFGLVPEGYSMDEVLRITNNTASVWKNISLDVSGLPSCFKLTSNGCKGANLGPHQSCAATLTFAPSAAVNRKFAPATYGQYHAINLENGAKLVHPRPVSPLVVDLPVEASPSGKLKVLANYNMIFRTGRTVLEVPVKGKSSGPFPLKDLQRVHYYYSFR
ncbi:MAG: hypothetical protein A2089_07345 [Elusimicrobia bacterium GWD2_63_28]|nr:MAG: hypothetical protein A2089_07345 [Elusimicrobia bacterium GWD2_63_28]